MFDSQVAAFALVAAALTVSPGADTMLVVRNVARARRKGGLLTGLGCCSGLFCHALLSAFGVSLLVLHSAWLFGVVKTAGALCLVWLGVQSLRGRGGGLPAAGGGRPPAPGSGRCFAEGLLSNVLNPKGIIFYLAFLPQFIAPRNSVWAQAILLTAIHFAMGVTWLSLLCVLFDRSRRLLAGAGLTRWVERCCGLLLVGLGVRLVLVRR